VKRNLFVYWRVDADRAEAAVLAVQAFHAGLRVKQPGVQTSLYRRSEASKAGVTLMEIYAAAGGFDDARQVGLLADASQVLAGWALEGRHVEVFDQLPA
jgi:hypothetical protein